MGAHVRIAAAPPRREEALAYIVTRILSSHNAPTYAEIAGAMRPRVGRTRAKQLVDQLVGLGVIDRDPGSQRGIRILDIDRCRAMIEDALGFDGWWHARPMGVLKPPAPCTNEQLPRMPAFEYLPDLD